MPQPEITLSAHWSNEAEQSCLGAVLVDNHALETLTGIIGVEDFYRPGHRHIFGGMLDLQQATTPIDFTTLAAALKASGKLETAGGTPYLLELADYVPTAANAAHYAKIIRTHAVQRSLADSALVMTVRVRQGDDPATVINEFKRTLDKLESKLDGAHGVNAADLQNFDDRLLSYHQFVARVNKYRFKTGFKELDKELRGVAPGEVLIIIAYSGTFKSALLQYLLLRSASTTGLLMHAGCSPVKKKRRVTLNSTGRKKTVPAVH